MSSFAGMGALVFALAASGAWADVTGLDLPGAALGDWARDFALARPDSSSAAYGRISPDLKRNVVNFKWFASDGASELAGDFAPIDVNYGFASDMRGAAMVNIRGHFIDAAPAGARWSKNVIVVVTDPDADPILAYNGWTTLGLRGLAPFWPLNVVRENGYALYLEFAHDGGAGIVDLTPSTDAYRGLKGGDLGGFIRGNWAQALDGMAVSPSSNSAGAGFPAGFGGQEQTYNGGVGSSPEQEGIPGLAGGGGGGSVPDSTASAVPEPPAWILMLLGLAGLAIVCRGASRTSVTGAHSASGAPRH